jgi:protein-S-isoprenylcysteine O-methyltransferase Ste14
MRSEFRSASLHIAEIFRLPFAIPFWIVFFYAFVREGRIIRGSLTSAPSAQDAGTFRAIAIGSPLALVGAGAASLVPWLAIPYPRIGVVVGMLMLVAGAVLRRYCFMALGASFTGNVVVAPGQRIVQDGVYRFVRHPSYTAALLMYTGIGIALGSWISVAILFFVHACLYGMRVAVEEKALEETLGEPYRAYRARTKRFVPFII